MWFYIEFLGSCRRVCTKSFRNEYSPRSINLIFENFPNTINPNLGRCFTCRNINYEIISIAKLIKLFFKGSNNADWYFSWTIKDNISTYSNCVLILWENPVIILNEETSLCNYWGNEIIIKQEKVQRKYITTQS
jgi:hypothetical protein